MLINPDSLVANLFKSLYFPTTSILEAILGHKRSPFWSGLIWGKELLQTGVGWHVGNGPQINIKEDNWLSSNSYYKLLQPQIVPSNLTKVSDLILSHNRCWNKELPSTPFILLTRPEFYSFLFLTFHHLIG